MANYSLLNVTKLACLDFITCIVEATYLRKLKTTDTFCTAVTTKALLDYLQKRCEVLHALNVVGLQLEM